MSNSKSKIHLLLGTHKGAFMFTSNPDRKRWDMTGPFLKGADINHITLDTRNQPTLYAAVNSYWWGPGVHYSKDFGATWLQAEIPVRFKENSDKKVNKLWHVSIAREEIRF